MLCGSLPVAAQAQSADSSPETAWRQCTAQTDSAARLACFDQWASAAPVDVDVDASAELPTTNTAPAPPVTPGELRRADAAW